MGWELANCQEVLLAEIANPAMYRRDIAKTYALALRSSEADSVDWFKVDTAIIARWSRSALDYIKETAWSGKALE